MNLKPYGDDRRVLEVMAQAIAVALRLDAWIRPVREVGSA